MLLKKFKSNKFLFFLFFLAIVISCKKEKKFLDNAEGTYLGKYSFDNKKDIGDVKIKLTDVSDEKMNFENTFLASGIVVSEPLVNTFDKKKLILNFKSDNSNYQISGYVKEDSLVFRTFEKITSDTVYFKALRVE